MKSQSKVNIGRYRAITQAFSFAFIILVPFLISINFREIIGNYYSFTIFGLEIADTAIVIQTILLSGEIFVPLVIAAIIPILVALVFGRVFCSWVCPYSAIQDFMEAILKRLFRRKSTISDINNPRPIWYWIILISFVVVIIVFATPVFLFISFPGIISTNISYLFIGMSLTLELIFMSIILFLEIYFSKRIWCKYICPIGSVLSIFRTSRTMRITYKKEQCDCVGSISPCKISCPLELDPKGDNLYPYCYNCGKCTKVCEKTGNGALEFRIKKIKY